MTAHRHSAEKTGEEFTPCLIQEHKSIEQKLYGWQCRARTAREYLPETKRGSHTVTPSYATRTYFRPVYADFLPTLLNRYINRIPELFSHFYQPSGADFALSDASRINVNFREGPSECIGKFAGDLIPILFLNHGDRYGLTFYRHLNAIGKG